ncbi:MAG: hypothetical protein PUH88_08810 [Lachnospiraceae bacterium]|nr:hypothetical protein [Lachnospiraceae bacterium]
MISKEKKRQISERCEILERRIEEKYERIPDIHGQKCFRANDHKFFMITGLSWADALVIEYAFSEDEAKKNMFEDGDLFYMDEMNEGQMFNAMIQEIES